MTTECMFDNVQSVGYCCKTNPFRLIWNHPVDYPLHITYKVLTAYKLKLITYKIPQTKSLMLTKPKLVWLIYGENSNLVKYYYNIKAVVIYFNM